MNRRSMAIVVVISIAAAVGIFFSFQRPGGKGNAVTSGSGAVSSLLFEAKNLEAQGNFLASSNIYKRLIGEFPNSREVLDWQKKLESMNIKLLFLPVITPRSIEYEIKPGDSLEKIARGYKTTPELIAKSNNIFGDKIFPGKKIKVWTAPFSIVVDKSGNTLILKSEEEIIKTYVVATGTNNITPVGTFKIIEKIVSPTWYKGGKGIPAGSPENILGSRWMGLDREGYGIHGTTDPKTLGSQVTAGCVRMANQDVEELYIIVPKGTEVTIVD
ncbi:MAG: L,D-transpeptidase family protein [Candidatus Omnitrophica bacterium]|nr:L,D-transpeptidase family protein [Candidatus Omnitrophota bacterium]MDD5079460.1 L,D-transpeptidase family protein [Candidatus Omnitrophota bacterium]